jgi:hypothetical protein
VVVLLLVLSKGFKQILKNNINAPLTALLVPLAQCET